MNGLRKGEKLNADHCFLFTQGVQTSSDFINLFKATKLYVRTHVKFMRKWKSILLFENATTVPHKSAMEAGDRSDNLFS